jgi:hypothetical protein
MSSDEVQLLRLERNLKPYFCLKGIHVDTTTWESLNDLADLVTPDTYELVVKKVDGYISVFRRKQNET